MPFDATFPANDSPVSSAELRDPSSASSGRPFWSTRLTIWASVLWVGALLLSWRILSTLLDIIRHFESDAEFHAHNRIHWFRPIAFFWFQQCSLLPASGLGVLVCLRHFLPHGRSFVTWVLALVTVALLALGTYTVWESVAVLHQFTR